MDKDICFSLSSLTSLKLGSPGSTIENLKKICWNKKMGKNYKIKEYMCVFYVAVEAAYHDHDYQILWHIHNNRFQR